MITQKQKKKEISVLCCISVIIFSLFLFLFYKQLTGGYTSDLVEHIEFAVSGRGYSVLYSLMGLVINLFNSTFSVVVMESLFVVATWLVTAKLISELSDIRYYYSALISLPILVLTGIFIPFIYPHLYRQQLITQPYHNTTYYAMRFLAVNAMLSFNKVFDGYLNKTKWKNWIMLAIWLALSTAVKPSFFYGFALSLLIFLIIDFFKTGFKSKPLGHIIIMGIVVFPSLLIMLSQYFVLYGAPASSASGESAGIILIWGKNFFKNGFFNTVLKLCAGLAFPAIVTYVNRKDITRFEKFVFIMYIIQLIICAMFKETGKREQHGNFYWGVYSAAYFVFVVTVPRFINNVLEIRKSGKRINTYTKICGGLLLAHLASSALYFAIVFLGFGISI